jgi:hypothetical protein
MNKIKSKKIERICNFYGLDGHLHLGFFNNMEALEVTMNKHNINIDSSSSNPSLMNMHFLLPVFPLMKHLIFLLMSVLLILEHIIIWLRIKPFFIQCNTKQIFVGADSSLSIVGSRTIYLDDGNFNYVICVPSLSSNIILVYQISHSDEGKEIKFSPHQVVIKDLKYPKNFLSTGIVHDITNLYIFENFGKSLI